MLRIPKPQAAKRGGHCSNGLGLWRAKREIKKLCQPCLRVNCQGGGLFAHGLPVAEATQVDMPALEVDTRNPQSNVKVPLEAMVAC